MSTPTPRTDAIYFKNRNWANDDEATEATEDLRDLARTLERELADSEAKAKQSLLAAYDAVVVQRNRVTTERDRLRAEVAQLQKNCTDIYDAMKKAEAETKFFATTNVSLNAEVERLTAEVANQKVQNNHNWQFQEISEEALNRAERAEAELAAIGVLPRQSKGGAA